VHKIDYYDRKQSLLKTLMVSEHALYLDRFWQPGRMQMVNHQTGKATELQWSNYQFNTGLTEADFTQNSLMRAR
jgi:outer membrane lipoprotein-sorting protein